MASKILGRNWNCIHCKQKFEKIYRSKVYWDKLIINKLNAKNFIYKLNFYKIRKTTKIKNTKNNHSNIKYQA